MTRLTEGLISKSECSKLEIVGVYFFWTAFLFELVYMVFRKCDYYLPQERIWIYGLVVCYLVKIACTKYTRNEWIAIIILLGISAMALLVSGNDSYFRILVFVIASKGIKRDAVFQGMWMSFFLMFLCVSGRCLLGISGTLGETMDYGRGGIETRYRFGFSHANQLHYYLFCLTAIYLWVNRKHVDWKNYVVLTCGNIYLFYLTHSRTGAGIIFLVILGFALMQYSYRLRESRWIYFMGYLLEGSVLLSSILAVSIDFESNLYLNKIDSLLTGRMHWAWYNLNELTPQLFSSRTDLGPVDMGIVRQAYGNGIAFVVLYAIAVIGLIYYSEREKTWADFIMLCAVICYTLIESNPATNPFPSQLLLCGLLVDRWYCLFQPKQNDRTENGYE